MKRIVPRAAAGLLLLSLLSAPAFGQGRFGTIDLTKVVESYYKTKQADTVMKQRLDDMEKDFKAMVTEYEKGKEEYQKLLTSANDPAVSTDEREKRKKSAEDKLKQLKEKEVDINSFRRDAGATLEEQKQRMLDNILVEIRTVVNAKAKAAGYSMVFNTSAKSINKTPIVFYANNENDLTEGVLSDLNRGKPAENPAAEDKKDDARKTEKK